MILTFQKTYRYSPSGLDLVTYYPGDTIDVQADGPFKAMIESVLESGHAIETKPDLKIETKSEDFSTAETVKATRKKGSR
jgi:hypothetical protein